MITLQALFSHLENLLKLPGIVDSCPNGLQVEGRSEVRKIGFAVSASLQVIESAVSLGVDALIVHHGIFWQKDEFPITKTKKKKIKALLENDISLFAYHLPLDAHKEIGNNWKAALDLGWTDLEPFGFLNGIPIGVKGKIPEQGPQDLKKKLESYYMHPAYVALGGNEKITSGAIISGGAHRCIDQAADDGVDVFVTGSFDEPVWDIAHERGVHFYALGHYATERIGIIALMEKLKKELHVPCEFIDFPNPF